MFSEGAQPYRAPYVVTFDIDGENLTLCNVLIVHAAPGGGNFRQSRVDEITNVGKYLIDTARREPAWRGAFVLVGNFNSQKVDGSVLEALRELDFYFDPDLASLPTSVFNDNVYDQNVHFTGRGRQIDLRADRCQQRLFSCFHR